MSWVRIFDDSFQRIPVKNYGAMYADGYRVMAGYVAGGTAGKWVTSAEIRAWFACGTDTGFLPLFEAVGNEPVTNPSSGRAHAKAARAGARARGVPDLAAISPAMDRDVTMPQAKGPIAAYMQLWKSTDMLPPLPYIELDAGAYLFAEHLTVGTGTPAAYEWDPSRHLITPDNAPAHVLWTQERNGINIHGGNVDIGHIRITAPIMWANPQHVSPEVDMPLSAADIEAIWAHKLPAGETAEGALQDAALRAGTITNTQLPALAGAVAADAKVGTAIEAAVATIAAGGNSPDTTAIIAAINKVGTDESSAVSALTAQVQAIRTALAAGDAAEAAALAAK
jgi:hypothetical protein